MPPNKERDPYLDPLIEQTVAPLSRLLPPDHLQLLSDVLRQSVADDPDLAQLYQAARPREVQANTRDQPVGPRPDGATEEPAQEPAKVAPLRRSGGAA